MRIKKTFTLALAIALIGAVSGASVAAAGGGVVANPGAMEGKHFHPKGKLPSKYTIELRKGVSATLPFEDKRDFDEAKKGFIAEPPYKKIMADAGHVAWDMGSYQWLLQGKDFDSIHPSLQRQAILNMAFGLYEVVPDKIYQVRGLRSSQYQLHQRRYRLDHLRSADGQGNRPGGARIHQREAR